MTHLATTIHPDWWRPDWPLCHEGDADSATEAYEQTGGSAGGPSNCWNDATRGEHGSYLTRLRRVTKASK